MNRLARQNKNEKRARRVMAATTVKRAGAVAMGKAQLDESQPASPSSTVRFSAGCFSQGFTDFFLAPFLEKTHAPTT
jgi:hypothetical protein